MSNTAPIFPSSSSGWTNSNNMSASDGAFATASCSRALVDGIYESTPTANLICGSFTNITSGVGSGDTINQLIVDGYMQIDRAVAVRVWVYLAVGGTVVSSVGYTDLAATGSTYYYLSFGGGSLTGANLANLQVVFYAEMQGSSGATTVSIDYCRAQAYYTPSTAAPFTFTDVTNAALNTLYVSNTITVSGLGGGVAAVSSNSIFAPFSKNGGPFVTSETAVDGDTFRIEIQSSPTPATAVNAILTIGGTSDTYTVTTLAADTTPDAFGFGTQSGVEINTSYQGNGIYVSGINTSTAISVSGGNYRVNGGGWTTGASTVVNGDFVEALVTSSGSYSTGATVTVTIGGVNGTFTATTRAANTTPAAFSWTNVAGAATSTVYTSNTITVSGIEAAANVSFVTSGGTTHEYSKNGGAWTAVGATTITNGQTLQVRMVSPAGAGAGNNTVTIGGVSDTYTVTTSVDTTPDAFTFNNVSSIAALLVTSNTITLAGMTAAVAVAATISGGLFKINGGGYVSSGNVVNGDTLTLQVTASKIPGKALSVVMSVESVNSTWVVTTRNVCQPDI